MYAAPVAALVGELFGKSRIQFFATTLVFPAAWLVGRAYLGTLPMVGPGAVFAPLDFLALVSFSFVLASVFAYVDFTAAGVNAGFPRHILLLPVPTWLLALVPIVTGSLFISGFVLLWLRYVSSVRFDREGQLIITAAITSLMCWIQAMSWEILPPRLLRVGVLTAIAIAVSLSVVSLLARQPDFIFGRAGGAAGLAATVAGGYGLAYLAVLRCRRGDVLESGVFLRGLRLLPASLFRRTGLPALRDGNRAQDWFEWRVYGWLFPSCMIALGAIPLVPLVLLDIFRGARNAPSIIVSAMMLAFFCLTAPLMGFTYASDKLAHRAQIGPFYATRPLSDLEMAFAKLKLAVKSHLLGLAIVFVMVAVVVSISRNNAAFAASWSLLTARQGAVGSCLGLFLSLMIATAASWAASAYFLSAALFMAGVDRTRHGWKISAGVVLLFLALLKLAAMAYRSRSSVLGWLESARLTVPIPAALAAALGLWLLSRFRQSNRLGELGRLAAGFAAGTGLCLLIPWQLDLPSGYRWALSWLVMAVAVLAFIPFLLLPILVDLNRHR